MISARNDVSLALFNLLQTVAPPTGHGWCLAERGARIWTNVEICDQPYIGLECLRQTAVQNEFGLTVWLLHYEAWVYFRNDGAPPAVGTFLVDAIDQFLDAIDSTLATGFPNTLGGLVTNCAIEGEINIEPGILDQQGIIRVPITILTAG